MASLTEDEKNYALSLLKHSVVFTLFDELEQSLFSEALNAKPHEPDKINSALGEIRALKNLRRSLDLIGLEAAQN